MVVTQRGTHEEQAQLPTPANDATCYDDASVLRHVANGNDADANADGWPDANGWNADADANAVDGWYARSSIAPTRWNGWTWWTLSRSSGAKAIGPARWTSSSTSNAIWVRKPQKHGQGRT